MASRAGGAIVGEVGAENLHHASPVRQLVSSARNNLPIRRQKLQFKLKTHASSLQVAEIVKHENLLDIDPAFYEMGYVRHLRAYGIDFKEGLDGVGVYSAKDIPYLRKPRIIMEIPLELMISVSKDPPWIFHPDFVPLGHPIFDIINSTDAEVDWDIRLACLLLLAMDTKNHFWQLYSDFLPEAVDCTSLLLATEGELAELQDSRVASVIRQQQKRAESAWAKYWTADSPLKLKRLARTSEQFKWAVAIAQTRHITMNMTVGARPQVANMFIPYIDMLNHSLQPTCSYRWRRKDRMLEVLVNSGQSIKAGTEMTLNYMEKTSNEKYLELFGFSSPANAWDKVNFLGKARIHKDSFLSAFHIAGLPDEYYFNEYAIESGDEFLDGHLLAIARSLPFWSEKDLPFLPSAEKVSVKELQEECSSLLNAYPTTLQSDLELLGSNPRRKSKRWRVAVEYRIQRKTLIKKIMKTLDLYLDRLLY